MKVFMWLKGLFIKLKSNVGKSQTADNKQINAISKGSCKSCGYLPKEDTWSLVCDCPCTCYSGEQWIPLKTTQICQPLSEIC